MDFYSESIAEVFKEVGLSEAGLTAQEAKERLKRYGENRLPASKAINTKVHIFISQWKSPLIIILVLAGTVSALLGDAVDAIIIGITVLVNVVVGFVQENKANQALKKLACMVTFSARVLRSGAVEIVPSSHVTLGDIIFLEAGDKVPADARLVETVELTTSEAALTGESNPVAKTTHKLGEKVPLAARENMVFQGTHVVSGRGTAVVVAIGVNTEVGRIASLVEHTEESKTPLQIQLSQLSKLIGKIVLAIAAVVFLIGLVLGSHTWLTLFQTAVALAVAAIPEGMAITLTVILAIGMQFLLRRNALVRKMVAAETLGSVTVICTDKTGTLTEGKMAVAKLVTADTIWEREQFAHFSVSKSEHQDPLLLLRAAAVCSNVFGDTTEVALVEAAAQAQLKKSALDIALPRLAEIPFDSRRKYMAVLNQGEVDRIIYVKGAYDVLRQHIKMPEKKLHYFDKANADFAQQGMRVLAVCYRVAKPAERSLSPGDIHDLVLVGLAVIADPIRTTVKDTIARAQAAGIRIIMVTGDQAQTAMAIGRELGIAEGDIYSRVNPEDKINIVNDLKKRGEIVAMTGDGVNDSPALKGADIGVAMGSGTDIAREIADLVLLDDRFETIVAAVEEGRTMYRNIQKVVLYLLAFSLCEVALITMSLVMGLPLALLPAQILWLNLVQDSLPAIALAFDRPEPGIMTAPPRSPRTRLVGREPLNFVISIMVITAGLSIGLFFYGLAQGDEVFARTLVFTSLGFGLLLGLYSIRLLGRHFRFQTLWDNFFLTGAVLLAGVLLIASLYLPPLQRLLGTVPLGAHEAGIVAGFCAALFILLELTKFFIFKKSYAVS